MEKREGTDEERRKNRRSDEKDGTGGKGMEGERGRGRNFRQPRRRFNELKMKSIRRLS